MLNVEQILNYFPPFLRQNAMHQKYIFKEYIQLMILDFLTTTKFVQKITFIGGTNLRLVKGIDRFSEDLDFDCKDLSKEEFEEMSQAVLIFLQRSGLHAEIRNKPSTKLTAFRSRIFFPEFLFDLGLLAYKEERFLIKLQGQDQEFLYTPEMTTITQCGFFISFPVPPDDILCAMKISALLSRAKGRDFYDTIFLLSQTFPNFDYLNEKQGIENKSQLKKRLLEVATQTDLSKKSQDFEHLLFNPIYKSRVLDFAKFINII